ncbi:MAG TPA: hypothetical protein VFB99_24005 [Vicinamibacterales bacterium]|nr:hypothetical protein [Vicinamibacterales bacterium]
MPNPLYEGDDHNLLGNRTVGDPHPQYVNKNHTGTQTLLGDLVIDGSLVVGGTGPDHISDADGDTYVRTEQNTDEDILRFGTAGTERMTIGSTGVVTINPGQTSTGDFVVHGASTTNLILADASLDGVGIGTNVQANAMRVAMSTGIFYTTPQLSHGGDGTGISYRINADAGFVATFDITQDTDPRTRIEVSSAGSIISFLQDAELQFPPGANTGLITWGGGTDTAVIRYDGADLVIDPRPSGAGDVLIPRDDAAVAFGDGAGGDARIYYDGADFVVDPRVVGSGALKVVGDFELGVNGSAGYDLDLFTSASGKGILWRPNAAGSNPKFSYMGVNDYALHWLLDSNYTASIGSAELIRGTLGLSQASGGKSIAIVLKFQVDDDRDITAVTGPAVDFVRPFYLVVDRSANYSNNQLINVGAFITEVERLEANDAGVYSLSTGGQNQELRFSTASFAAFAPTFSATSGSNSYTIRGQRYEGVIGGNGNAQTSLAVAFVDIATSYLQVSGVLGFGAGGSHYGLHYHPSVTVGTGTLTEAALRADRSGILLASDDAGTGFAGGYILMGAGQDVRIGYTGTVWDFDVKAATTEIVFNNSGVDTDFRIESDGDTHMFFIDAGADGGAGRVGIGTPTPEALFDVDGQARVAMLQVDADLGSGTTSLLTIPNSVAAVSGATPAVLATTGGGPTGAAQTHWLKIYHGTTARYIPVWT